MDDTEIQIMTGRCWAVLRHPLRAITALEAVLRTFEDTRARDKALYLSFLADAYVDANEIEQAAAVVGRVMDLSASVASVRPGQRVEAILPRLSPYRSLPTVADVLGRRLEWATRPLPSSVAPSPGTPLTPPPPVSR